MKLAPENNVFGAENLRTRVSLLRRKHFHADSTSVNLNTS
jgi:hypothetical protein